MLEFAGAFFEDFKLVLGESEHFYLWLLDVIFIMIITGDRSFFYRRLTLMG